MPSQARKFLEVSEVEKSAIFKHFGVSEDEFEEMVEIIKTWIKKTPLPQEDNITDKLRTALLNSKMNMEKCKRSIEGYYKIRTIHSAFFDRLVPNTPDYALAKTLAKTAVMPKLTPDLCRLTIFRIDNPSANAPDGLIYEILSIMAVEYRIFTGDYFYSNTLIIDLKNMGIKNFIKYTPEVCNTIINCLVAINLRLKNIHFVNLPSIFEKILMTVKFFLPSQFFAKLRIHQNFETLYEMIPKEYLPSNYGGTQPSIEEIQEKWCEMLEEKEEDFKKLLKAKCADTNGLQIENGKNSEMDGSFRKLAID